MGDATVTSREDRENAAAPDFLTAADRPGRLRRLRTPRRPRLWFEILLIAVSYWTYSLIRNAVPEQRAQALRNADWIWRMEHHLGIAVEESVNHTVNSVTWLIVGMNYYYATLHFIVTLSVLVWLYRSHPGRYAATRLVLFATTGVALVGYYLYPLAPPRLMNGGDFVDTVTVHQTWGSMASGDLQDMSNQYAAMPSMHIGWSLWCGLTIFALASVPWVRVLGLLYPAATLLVIVSTANHFWLDAVGGILCLTFGFMVARVWYGALPYALPRTVPPKGAPQPKAEPRYRTSTQCSTVQGGGVGHPRVGDPEGRSGTADVALSDNVVGGPAAGPAGRQARGDHVRPPLGAAEADEAGTRGSTA